MVNFADQSMKGLLGCDEVLSACEKGTDFFVNFGNVELHVLGDLLALVVALL